MSKYTTTIYYLKQNGFDFQLNDYPIFDENYRETLNNLILDNFLMDEIGFETPGLFRHYLKTKLNEIMPYYNLLYKAQKEIAETDNMFGNVNLREEFNRHIDSTTTSEGNSTSQNTANGKSKQLYQETPQGNLKTTDIDNANYATNMTLNKSEAESNTTVNDNTTSTGNNLESYLKTITGNNGKMYNIELLQKALEGFKNINTQLLKELEPLFMGIY